MASAALCCETDPVAPPAADSPPPGAPGSDDPFYIQNWTARGELRCPHCKSQAIRRSSQEVTVTFRIIYYVCGNAACGHSWKASLSYDYGLSPSAIPDPSVNLPLRPMNRADVVKPDPPPPDDPDQFRLI